jgi:hypothetical protein
MAKGLHFPKASQGQILAVKQYLRDIVYGRWMPMVSSKLGDASRPTAFLGARSACKQKFRPKILVHCICITVSVWRLFLSVTLNPASHMIYIQKIHNVKHDAYVCKCLYRRIMWTSLRMQTICQILPRQVCGQSNKPHIFPHNNHQSPSITNN